ncbi:MAG TPA: ATP-binding protein [Chloroflexia bacterium]|jgi:signal transduction histidine kinase/CHASE3 domain sensor protein
MRIRHKIFLGYVALISVALVLVAFFLTTLSDINHRYAALISRDQQVLRHANDLRAAVLRQVVAARTYEQLGDLSLLVEYNDTVRQQEDAVNQIEPLLSAEEDRQAIDNISRISRNYSVLARETMELSRLNFQEVGPTSDANLVQAFVNNFLNKRHRQMEELLSLKRVQGETARLGLSNAIESFIIKKNDQVVEGQVALGAKVDEISAQLLIWSLFGIIGTLVTVTLLTEGFTAPLRRLMRNIQGISSGDLQTAVAVHSKDEIGELATVLETMRQRLATAASENESLLQSAREEAEKLARTRQELEEANVELQEALVTESEARQRIEEIDRLKSEFTSMVSHELKTPVSYVYNYAGALKEHGSNLNEGQQTEFLTAIQGEAQHLITLIDDIMAISLLEAGGLSHRFVETDLRKLVDAVVKDQQLTTRRHTISVKGPDSLAVRADPTRLRQVLNNLLSNAIKYSPNGGPVEVRLRSNHASGQAIIYVRDHGIGVDPDEVPRLFERFHRVQRKETMAIPGSGLGLYIAHHIVQAHGGTLSLQPAPGKGTIAEVTVGLMPEETPADGEGQARNGRKSRKHTDHDAGAEADGLSNGAIPTSDVLAENRATSEEQERELAIHE